MPTIGARFRQRLAQESLLEELTQPAPEPSSFVSLPSSLRVVFVTSANSFIFAGDKISTKEGLKRLPSKPRYETRATVGFLANRALIQYLSQHTKQLLVAAIETLDESLKHDPDRVEVERWSEYNNLEIHRGSIDALVRLTSSRDGGEGGLFDVAISSVLDPRFVSCALRFGARRTVCMIHDYHCLPYGPWSSIGLPEDNEAWVQQVSKLDAMLCTSADVAQYVRHWGAKYAAPASIPCPAVDYHYVPRSSATAATAGGSDGGMPEPFEPWNDGGSPERCTPELPPEMASALASALESPPEPAHKFVTCVSPSPLKGLGVLLRLAMELPHVPFLAVQTAWTKPADLLAMWLHARTRKNLTIVPAAPDFTSLLRRTKVLLVPSLWREAFGLVALEGEACPLCPAPTVPTIALPRSAPLSTAHDRTANANARVRACTLSHAALPL